MLVSHDPLFSLNQWFSSSAAMRKLWRLYRWLVLGGHSVWFLFLALVWPGHWRLTEAPRMIPVCSRLWESQPSPGTPTAHQLPMRLQETKVPVTLGCARPEDAQRAAPSGSLWIMRSWHFQAHKQGGHHLGVPASWKNSFPDIPHTKCTSPCTWISDSPSEKWGGWHRWSLSSAHCGSF